jgi:hypothetical protein
MRKFLAYRLIFLDSRLRGNDGACWFCRVKKKVFEMRRFLIWIPAFLRDGRFLRKLSLRPALVGFVALKTASTICRSFRLFNKSYKCGHFRVGGNPN